jgi:D-glycero-D-manno-heptose 1,7-bisphosphate phosphatase
MRITQAAILVGGRGTRLGQRTDNVPKPMLPVGGRPFLDYQLDFLRQSGITEVVMCVGYLAEVMQARYGGGPSFGLRIVFSREPSPAGTGGALVNARPHLADTFFVLNGDTILDVELASLGAALAEDTSMLGAIALRQVPDTGRFGRVSLEGNKIISFDEKSATAPGLINGGVYCMKRAALDLLPPTPCSLEKDLFPRLAKERRLAGKAGTGYFIDIGLPETLAQADRELPGWMKSRHAQFAG